MAKRKTLKIVAHYMLHQGERVLIDPYKTDLPDRCKLAVAEVITGSKCDFVKVGS
ncbi:hypothetical protein D3C86_952520 [compost metagenome]